MKYADDQSVRFSLLVVVAHNFSLLPLRISVVLGFAMALLGFSGALLVILDWAFERQPAGWASTMVVVLLLSGMQLLMLGIVGEYIGRVFLTANHKPQGLVRAVVRPPPEHPLDEEAA